LLNFIQRKFFFLFKILIYRPFCRLCTLPPGVALPSFPPTYATDCRPQIGELLQELQQFAYSYNFIWAHTRYSYRSLTGKGRWTSSLGISEAKVGLHISPVWIHCKISPLLRYKQVKLKFFSKMAVMHEVTGFRSLDSEITTDHSAISPPTVKHLRFAGQPTVDLIFVVPCVMLYSEIIPTRCNNCVYFSQWLYSTCFG